MTRNRPRKGGSTQQRSQDVVVAGQPIDAPVLSSLPPVAIPIPTEEIAPPMASVPVPPPPPYPPGNNFPLQENLEAEGPPPAYEEETGNNPLETGINQPGGLGKGKSRKRRGIARKSRKPQRGKGRRYRGQTRKNGGGIGRELRKQLSQFELDPFGTRRTGRANDLITMEALLSGDQWRRLKKNFLHLATTDLYSNRSGEFDSLYKKAEAAGAFKKST